MHNYCLIFIPADYMKQFFPSLLVLVMILLTNKVFGQITVDSWLDYESGRLSINGYGMGVLILWASANILTGIIGWIFKRGTFRYFFQMNALWNVVNLGIGLAGYFDAATDLSSVTQGQIITTYHDMQNLYLLNAGLDIAYIAIALLLLERAKNIRKWRPLLRGYGYSLILQGSFLFIFDLIMFFIHKSHALKHLYPLLG